MNIGALISGGKDSLYAAYLAAKKHKLVCLISLNSLNKESYMFHIPNIELVKSQAKAMNLPIIFEKTEGKKEKELKDLENSVKKAKSKYKIEGLVSGALASNYQKERIEKICKKLNLSSITPLWHINEEKYMHALIKDGFKVIITAIAADGLDKSFLGRIIDKKIIEKLKKINKKTGIHLAFEGGEAETLVLDCPLFNKKIKVADVKIEMENECTGHYLIKKAILVYSKRTK